ncbi:MAG: small ribosomal subunit Rsm22 family protein [Chthoniobacteraceae bacterium]
MKHWTPQQLDTLARLRDGFLTGAAGARDYWRSREELALYDETFAQRIGWKWDAVLHEVKARAWHPKSRTIVDWGCGSGIAHRRVLAAFPGQFTQVLLHDRSPLAMQFAADQLRAEFPGVESRSALAEPPPPGALLVVSHVVNELPGTELSKLLHAALAAQEVLWVEAGTHADSRALIAIREQLRENLTVIAPCTHAEQCGLLTKRNDPHWCHHFAQPPSQIFQDARWHEFSRELGIDLRSLPYSFLLLSQTAQQSPVFAGASRVIGRTRDFKGYSKILSCQEEGVADLMLQKRDAPRLLREVQEQRHIPVYRWTRAEERISAGEPCVIEPAEDVEPA